MSSVRALAAGTAAIAVSGMVAASAAWLGGLTTKDLGADSGIIAACDSDGLTVGPYRSTYTSRSNPSVGGFNLTTFSVSGIAATCAAQKINLVLGKRSTSQGTGNSNAVYWTAPEQTVGASGTEYFTISAGDPTWGIFDESVDSVSIVIAEP